MKPLTDRQTLCVYFGIIAAVVFGLFAVWVGSSYFEASAYRRLTGKSVTTWDAMWLELRVQEQAR
jgi:hypothetical protein